MNIIPQRHVTASNDSGGTVDVLSVDEPEFNVIQTLGRRLLPRDLDHLRRNVRGEHVAGRAHRPGGGNRRLTGAAGDIENPAAEG